MLSCNVTDLLRSAPGTSESHDITLMALPLADGLELAEPIVGRVRLTNSGRSILVRGHLETTLAEGCSRCLRPARSRVSVDLEDEALPSLDLDSGLPVDTSDGADVLRLSDHHELDLEPVIRDAISLAEPIAPLCRPDCPGLCEDCGTDMSDAPGHQHPNNEVDPRLASLAGMRDQLQ